MSLHDEYARVTPFEIAFPDEEGVDRLLEEIRVETESRGVDPQLPGVFTTLGSVADFVGELKEPDAPPEAAYELGALLFHAVHFAREGQPLYLLRTAATRYLIEGPPSGEPRPPAAAGYLQLPQHLFWIDSAGEGTPESIDGLFWFVADQGVLHALPITGLVPGRMGFRALPLPEAPMADAGRWLDTDVRDEGDDYASSLPGRDLDQLYSMEKAGEVLKLLVRFFAYLDAVPGARESASPPPEIGPDGGPPPSRLPYSAVTLVA